MESFLCLLVNFLRLGKAGNGNKMAERRLCVELNVSFLCFTKTVFIIYVKYVKQFDSSSSSSYQLQNVYCSIQASPNDFQVLSTLPHNITKLLCLNTY